MSRRRGIKDVDPKYIAWLLILGVPMYLFAKCQGWVDEPEKSEPEPFSTAVTTAKADKTNSEHTLPPEEAEELASISESIAEALAEIDPKYAEDIDPIAVSAKDLMKEITEDAEAAQEKYLHKWVEVEGAVWEVYYSSVGTVHYNYGGGAEGDYNVGELNRIIDGIKIKSGLVYWLTDDGKYKMPTIVAEMDMSLCDVYYERTSKITVVGYCESVTENNVVLTNGRYPEEENGEE